MQLNSSREVDSMNIRGGRTGKGNSLLAVLCVLLAMVGAMGAWKVAAQEAPKEKS